MVDTQTAPTPAALVPKLRRFFGLSAAKIRSLEAAWRPEQGSPVFTAGGKYTTRGWTEWTRRFYEMALKISGAVQAARWSRTSDGGGYIYSFNGPHSLFVDTMRTVRALAVGHVLGHALMGENDKKISLLERAAQHARA